MREQRERDAKRELKLAGQSAAKQRTSGELSDRALADVAMPATQGPASKHPDELDDAALLDGERALIDTNSARADERGLVVECGRGAPSEPADIPAASPTGASTGSTSEMTEPPPPATEPVPSGQPRSKPRAARLGRPSSASESQHPLCAR